MSIKIQSRFSPSIVRAAHAIEAAGAADSKLAHCENSKLVDQLKTVRDSMEAEVGRRLSGLVPVIDSIGEQLGACLSELQAERRRVAQERKRRREERELAKEEAAFA